MNASSDSPDLNQDERKGNNETTNERIRKLELAKANWTH